MNKITRVQGRYAVQTCLFTIAFTFLSLHLKLSSAQEPLPRETATQAASGSPEQNVPSGQLSPPQPESWEEDIAAEESFVDLQPLHCRACNDDERLQLRTHDRRWQFGGWVQQGVTYNPADPRNRLNAPVLFNDRANDYQLNQFYVFAGKEVRTDQGGWDLGGRIDLTYGTDSRFVTVPGLEEHDDRTRRWNSETSDYGFALPQAYLDIGTPVGPYGGTLRLGHFYALGGYETFAAPDNFFYSHAYTYLYGEPFTHTGAMWLQKLNPTTAFSVAGTTGWDSFYGDTNEWGVKIGAMKKFNAGQTTIAITGYGGEDFTGVTTGDGPKGDTRVWGSIVMKHYLQRCLYYVFQGDYGRQNEAVLVLDNVNNTIGFDTGQWWGVNQYLVYQFNRQCSAGLRFEWFRDEGNSRVGVPVEYTNGGPAFDGNDYFALTAGWNYKPHSNVLLRQEIRWDSSNVESNPNIPGGMSGIRPFNDRSDSDQLTVAMDLVLLF